VLFDVRPKNINLFAFRRDFFISGGSKASKPLVSFFMDSTTNFRMPAVFIKDRHAHIKIVDLNFFYGAANHFWQSIGNNK
jgi:hypothetical protein